MIQKLLKLYSQLKLKLREKKFENRLKYVYYKEPTDTLIIVFSAFSPRPLYNYIRTLNGLRSASRLFILDDFGHKGSYYWFEQGTDKPLQLTKRLISTLLENGGYTNLVTMGTSKGGTCAIYYGLMFNAKHIYAGACQYYVGNYLNTQFHKPILDAMVGRNARPEDVDKLNKMLPEMLNNHRNSSSLIHLLYSKEESTYQEHIVPLTNDLKENGIPFVEEIESFENHNDVGKFFTPYIRRELNITKTNRNK